MTILSKDINKNSPIAFFDSGLGGLTVLEKLRKLLPNEDFVYLGDTKNVPYGNKTKEQLLSFSKSILKFFEKKNCKAVVMACNTTSSMIYEDIKNKYNFKVYPIVQSVAKILSQNDIERLGVFATKATVESQIYQKEINKYNPNIKVFSKYCPQWVSIVESNKLNDEDSFSIVKADLEEMMKNNPQKIVLGCTHYPFLLNILSKYQQRELFIDPAVPFANYIKTDLENSGLLKENDFIVNEEFYVTSCPQAFYEGAQSIYPLKNLPILVDFD